MKLVVTLLLVAAAVAARPQSDCEKHRESAIRTGGIMKLIPECDEKGDYKEKQCYQDSPFCVCYNKKGHPCSPPVKGLEECDCYFKQKDRKDLGSSYVPQCETSGKWSKKQIWEEKNTCWCVDNKGEKHGSFGSDCKTFTCE